MKEVRVIEGQTITRSAYSAIHHWLKYHYGVATKCEGDKCLGFSKKYQWAKKRGVLYDYKRENFIQLCRSCHSRYDFTEESIQKMRESNPNTHKKVCINGHSLADAYKLDGWRECRTCRKLRKQTKEAKEREQRWKDKNKERFRVYSRRAYRKKHNVKPESYIGKYKHESDLLSALTKEGESK